MYVLTAAMNPLYQVKLSELLSSQ